MKTLVFTACILVAVALAFLSGYLRAPDRSVLIGILESTQSSLRDQMETQRFTLAVDLLILVDEGKYDELAGRLTRYEFDGRCGTPYGLVDLLDRGEIARVRSDLNSYLDCHIASSSFWWRKSPLPAAGDKPSSLSAVLARLAEHRKRYPYSDVDDPRQMASVSNVLSIALDIEEDRWNQASEVAAPELAEPQR